jgi:hypothetical protein
MAAMANTYDESLSMKAVTGGRTHSPMYSTLRSGVFSSDFALVKTAPGR